MDPRRYLRITHWRTCRYCYPPKLIPMAKGDPTLCRDCERKVYSRYCS